MPVHPTIAEFYATLPPSDATPPDVAQWRAQGEAHVPPLADRLPLHAVAEETVETDAGSVPVRIYTPAAGERYGILVYIHGGAFFSGSFETHDHVARRLAAASGFRVVSVGYRLAPEHLAPAGLDDCYAVVRWAVARGRDELAWDGRRLALAGDSSGGTFAAVVAARAHDDGLAAITHQVLLYPSVDLRFDVDRYASLRENAVGYGLETAALRPHNSFYLDSGADPADPLVSPILRDDLTGLPPALVVTAEFDPLRDEGEEYARRLSAAGVPTTAHRYEGAGHGFVQHFSHLPEYAGVFDEIAAFVATPATAAETAAEAAS